MANDVTSNPIRLDTASGAVLTAKRFHVTLIRWIGATAGGQVVVTDAQGHTKWASVANASNFVDDCTPGGQQGVYWDGLRVPTLTSGTLYITVT